MAIEYDINALYTWLEQPDNKELGEAILKELDYLQDQSNRLQERKRKYLKLLTVKNIISKFREYDAMTDGRMDTNEQPF